MKKIKSRLLLMLQLLSIGYIMIFSGIVSEHLLLLTVQLVGIVLGLWATYYLFKFSKFNAFAELRDNASLIVSGPYKIVRNPIYLAVLLYTLPLVLEEPSFYIIFSFIVLVVVLMLKIRLEESYLVEEFKNFKKYKKNTWKLIPLIY